MLMNGLVLHYENTQHHKAAAAAAAIEMIQEQKFVLLQSRPCPF